MLWENIEEYYGNMDPRTFLIGKPTNMACHNICTKNKAPEGIEHLLGLGAKYCVQRTKLDPKQIDKTMKRLRNNIRWKYIFRNQPDDGNYIPGMYINSDREPGEVDASIENCMNDIETRLKIERRKYSGKRMWPNLTPMQSGLINKLSKNEIHKIISADKNCGLSIIETEFLTQRGISDHLSNSKVYKRLSKREALGQLEGVERMLQSFVSKHADRLSEAEYTYLKRGLKRDRKKLARFYMTIKVHKRVDKPVPHPFRPIVATCGTALAILSKWLDHKLQQLKPHILTYVKDSDEFLKHVKAFQKLQKNGKLPKNARHFTADAESMYTYIDTDHALEVLRLFLEELEREGKLPTDFDIDMIMQAATLIMKWNLFEFGNTFFKQLLGTAMGTPVAVIWAMIYFWWHEKHRLIPRHGRRIPYMKRYIDDIYAIALVGGEDGFSKEKWEIFKKDINDFGILKWNVEDPSFSVDFLDLTLKIEDGNIVSKTYQKPTNLYQYICPNSAHPPWMIGGIVFSMLKRYYHQNTHVEDYWRVAMSFYKRLKDRGWDRRTLETAFVSAHMKITSPPAKEKKTKDEISNRETVILHFEYNRHDIQRKKVREIWNETCGLLEKSISEGGLDIKRVICAYSRPRNLRDLLQRAQLHQNPDHKASTYL
jgi:hypothetical protein